MCKTINQLIQKIPENRTDRLRLLSLFLIISGVVALAFAYTMQYGVGLQPCILCLYQRWPYRIAIGLGVFALILYRQKPTLSFSAIALTAPVFFSGAIIGFFQVGVEQHWWTGTEECTGGLLSHLNPEQLLEKISAAPLVRCDEIQFSLFGITLAGYNALLSLGLTAAIVTSLLFLNRKFKPTEAQEEHASKT